MRGTLNHAFIGLTLTFACWAHPDSAKVSLTHEFSGNWTATDFHDPTNPGCSVGINSSIPGSRLIMGANRRRSDPVTLLLKRDQWRISPGTVLQAIAQFPNDSRVELNGIGDKQNFNIDLSGTIFAQWVHALKNNKIMQITLGGQEPTWVFDLEGVTAILNSMTDCLQGHQITGIPAGLTEAVASETTTQSAPATLGSQVLSPPTPSFPAEGQTSSPAAAAPPPPIAAATTSVLSTSAQLDRRVIIAWSGAQDMQTRPFHADGPWEMQWTSGEGHFSIVLHDANGGPDKLLVNTLTPGSSSYFMPRGGDYFAEISANSGWSARVVPLSQQNTPNKIVPAAPPSAVSDPQLTPPVPQSSSTSAQGVSLTEASNLATPPAVKQDSFLAAVVAAQRQYADGQNEMAKGAARAVRKQTLCQLMRTDDVIGWSGKISELSTNGDGKGVISIEIGSHTHFQTWNNSLSDVTDHTLIDPESPLFQKAVKLHLGDEVRFTAELLPSTIDCFEEGSLTLVGSITDPDFIMRLISIESAF